MKSEKGSKDGNSPVDGIRSSERYGR